MHELQHNPQQQRLWHSSSNTSILVAAAAAAAASTAGTPAHAAPMRTPPAAHGSPCMTMLAHTLAHAPPGPPPGAWQLAHSASPYPGSGAAGQRVSLWVLDNGRQLGARNEYCEPLRQMYRELRGTWKGTYWAFPMVMCEAVVGALRWAGCVVEPPEELRFPARPFPEAGAASGAGPAAGAASLAAGAGASASAAVAAAAGVGAAGAAATGAAASALLSRVHDLLAAALQHAERLAMPSARSTSYATFAAPVPSASYALPFRLAAPGPSRSAAHAPSATSSPADDDFHHDDDEDFCDHDAYMPVAEYATRMRATGHPTGYCWRWLDNAECPGSCRFKHQHPPGWSAAQRRAHGEKQYQVYRDQERAEADALDAYMGTAHWCSSCEQSTDECDCVECGDCGKRVDESVMCAVADCCCMECCGCAQCSRCRGHIAEEEVAFLGESELDEGEEEEEEKEPMCPACFEKAVGEQRRRREQQQQQQQEQQQQHQERQRWPEQEAHLESEACGGDTEECGCERCEACTGLFDQDGGSAARCPQEEGSCTDCCDCQRCSGCGRHAAAREGLARAGSAAGGRESLCPTCIMMGALMNAVAGPGGSDGGGRGGGRGGGSEGGSRGGSGGGSGGSGAPGASRGPRPLHGPNIVGFTWAQLGCLKAQILVFRRLKMSNRLTAADLGAGVQPPPLSAVV